MMPFKQKLKNQNKLQKFNLDNYPLIHYFLNRKVRVQISQNLTVEGMLVRYQNGDERKHLPNVLILKNAEGLHVLRGNWLNISEAKS